MILRRVFACPVYIGTKRPCRERKSRAAPVDFWRPSCSGKEPFPTDYFKIVFPQGQWTDHVFALWVPGCESLVVGLTLIGLIQLKIVVPQKEESLRHLRVFWKILKEGLIKFDRFSVVVLSWLQIELRTPPFLGFFIPLNALVVILLNFELDQANLLDVLFSQTQPKLAPLRAPLKSLRKSVKLINPLVCHSLELSLIGPLRIVQILTRGRLDGLKVDGLGPLQLAKCGKRRSLLVDLYLFGALRDSLPEGLQLSGFEQTNPQASPRTARQPDPLFAKLAFLFYLRACVPT